MGWDTTDLIIQPQIGSRGPTILFTRRMQGNPQRFDASLELLFFTQTIMVAWIEINVLVDYFFYSVFVVYACQVKE